MYFCIVKCIGGYETMNSYFSKRNLILCILLMVVCNISNADDRHYRKARTFHAEGMFDEAVSLIKNICPNLSMRTIQTRLSDTQKHWSR